MMDYRYYYENETPTRPGSVGRLSSVRKAFAFGFAAALALGAGALVTPPSIASAKAEVMLGATQAPNAVKIEPDRASVRRPVVQIGLLIHR